jgi:hypothetical protein
MICYSYLRSSFCKHVLVYSEHFLPGGILLTPLQHIPATPFPHADHLEQPYTYFTKSLDSPTPPFWDLLCVQIKTNTTEAKENNS